MRQSHTCEDEPRSEGLVGRRVSSDVGCSVRVTLRIAVPRKKNADPLDRRLLVTKFFVAAGLRRERTAATTGAGGVGIAKDEAAAHQLIAEVDRDAAKIQQ